jgi:PEP-CTERM motif-containing protein
MRTIGLSVLLTCVIGISTLSAGPCTAGAGVWNEGDNGEGDAGKLPASANITIGVGSLTTICGNLTDASGGADMFEISITGSSFSAITSLRGSSALNPALYLFNSSGVALFAENDISGTNDQAQIQVASGLTPGEYFLVVAPDNQQPKAPGGAEIFGNITGTTGQMTPVASDTNLKSWTDAGDSSGQYVVSLTDAGFAESPEPAAFALVGAGLLALAGFRRTRK